MASQTGQQNSNIIDELVKKPSDFSFIQAVRLLAHECSRNEEFNLFFNNKLRIRADLSLGFPDKDLISFETLPDHDIPPVQSEQIRLTASFFGLYGVSSPLPTFYTEDLLNEASNDESVSRDFMDIPGQALYSLYVMTMLRYRLMDQVVSFNRFEDLERLFCLVGLGHSELRSLFNDPDSLIRVAGLFSQFPRSAAGLKCLLSDQLDAEINVEQCLPERLTIPRDQLCRLGSANTTLGEDLQLGEEVIDSQNHIELSISGLTPEKLRDLSPGQKGHTELLKLVEFYIPDPLTIDLTLHLSPRTGTALELGNPATSLGTGSWLGEGSLEQAKVTFPLIQAQSFKNQPQAASSI